MIYPEHQTPSFKARVGFYFQISIFSGFMFFSTALREKNFSKIQKFRQTTETLTKCLAMIGYFC